MTQPQANYSSHRGPPGLLFLREVFCARSRGGHNTNQRKVATICLRPSELFQIGNLASDAWHKLHNQDDQQDRSHRDQRPPADAVDPRHHRLSRLRFARLTARPIRNHHAQVASASAAALPVKVQNICFVSVILVGGVASCRGNQAHGTARRLVPNREHLFPSVHQNSATALRLPRARSGRARPQPSSHSAPTSRSAPQNSGYPASVTHLTMRSWPCWTKCTRADGAEQPLNNNLTGAAANAAGSCPKP